MTFRNKKLVRVIAIFFMLEMVADIAIPYAAFALTSGPTAPEATSFEPVDTTDMVNLATGDLAYNIPLLEVPGPSGGYPLSLSYHAGIMPNEEASWVGLGWTLNPGAITREVSGHPDDYKDALSTDRFFWQGGEKHTGEIGLTYGIAGTGSVTAGLSFSKDTYQGFGVGSFVTVGFSLIKQGEGNVGVGGSVTVGTDPFGGPYMSAGVGVGISKSQESAVSLSVGVSVSTNFKSVSAGAGAGVSVNYADQNAQDGKSGFRSGSSSVIGASISSSGASGSVSVGGNSQSQNRKTGKISTSSFGITLPLPYVHLGYKYQRYWIDETDLSHVNGVLHFPDAEQPLSYFDDHAFDVYSLLDPTVPGGIVDQPDPDKVLGGTFPDFDHFSVNAQGISGNIKPFLGEAYLDKQTKYGYNDGDRYNTLMNKQLGVNDKSIHFRFIGEFSNQYSYSEPDFNFNEPHIGYVFNGTRTAGENGYGYNENSNELAGMRHIEYYTNAQINNETAKNNGFIDTKSYESGFVRQNDDLIGGFKITNESGVTYHFALPAYSKNEYQYSTNIEYENGLTYNERLKLDPYAYTWYLTAVTGPDYVDRNNNGNVDESDWGYWVEFDYGLWASNYYWRNPGEGFHEDIDSNFKNFAEGYKEIYYLDAIKTKTHTALFIKDIRNDGKSAICDTWRYYSDTNMEGGYYPRQLREERFDKMLAIWPQYNGLREIVEMPTSSLKLDKIILVNNDQTIDKSRGSELNYSREVPNWTDHEEFVRDNSEYLRSNHRPNITNYHSPENVYDKYDFEAVESTIKSKIIREIDLGTDYSLMDNTPNSYSSTLLQGTVNTNKAYYDNSVLTGKLTLKSITNKGKQGIGLIPPMTFAYDKNPNYKKDAYDIWGMYKSDYEGLTKLEAERFVSKNSAENIDAWSLSSIKSNLGSTINISYSCDVYNNSELSIEPSLTIKSMESYSTDFVKVLFYDGIDFRKIFDKDDNVRLKFMVRWTSDFAELCYEDGYAKDGKQIYENFDKALEIEEVAENYVLLKSSEVSYMIDNGLGIIPYLCPSNQSGQSFVINYEYPRPPKFLVGNLIFDRVNFEQIGGGLRVDEIKINQSNTSIKKTKYNYLNGTTSFEPLGLSTVTFEPNNLVPFFYDKYEEMKGEYKTEMFKTFSEILANSREVPSPGVVYKKVRVEEEVNGNKLPGYTEYEFQTFEKNMVTIEKSRQEDSFPAEDRDIESIGGIDLSPNYLGYVYDKVRTKSVQKRDYSARVGALKSITLFDDNDNPVSKTQNHYLFEESYTTDDELMASYNGEGIWSREYDVALKGLFNNQGYMEETYAHASLVKVKLEDGSEPYQLLGTISKHKRYPLVSLGQTNINYKTGITTSTRNLAFDFFSGAVTKTVSKDGYGHYVVSETTPAYKKYPSMGLGIYGKANMLSQTAASKNVSYSLKTTPVNIYSLPIGFGSDEIEDLGNVLQEGDIITFNYDDVDYVAQLGPQEIKKSQEFHDLNYFTAPPVTEEISSNVVVTIYRDNKNFLSASAQTWSNQIDLLNYDNEFITGSIYHRVSGGFDIDNYLSVPQGSFSVNDKVNFTFASGDEKAFVIKSWSSSENAYLVESSGDPYLGTFNGIAMLWSPYKKHRSYSFIGDPDYSFAKGELYDYNDFEEFDAWEHGSEPSSNNWQKNSEITLYDVYSHALEASDVNGNFAATKMDSKQEKVLATVANAQYDEFAFTGVEDELVNGYFGGNVEKTGGEIVSNKKHTGTYSIKTTGTQKPIEFIAKKPVNGTTYRASIWSTEDVAKFRFTEDGGAIKYKSSTSNKKAGNWYLHNIDFVFNGSTELKVWYSNEEGKETYWDDFRLHPLDATMTSYVYNNFGELTHILDANNIFTKYEYDAIGRLTSVYRETFYNGSQKRSETVYNYGDAEKFEISITTSGQTGYITPNGNIPVAFDGDLEINAHNFDNCPVDKFEYYQIDNSSIYSNSGQLPDGTNYSLNGLQLTLSNIKGSHAVKAKFEQDSYNIGEVTAVSCHMLNGNPSGLYNYTIINECGEEEQFTGIERSALPYVSFNFIPCN